MDDSEIFKEYGYSLEELIESDEWGELYRARYLPHDRAVLFRAFPPGITREAGAWELLLAEIQAWARLDHPGVLQVLDWGESPGGHYLSTVMPGGEPLGALLSEECGVAGADEIFTNLLVSVESARQWGVLHLGLGPTNIWVSRDNAVEVGEFGFWYVTREFQRLEIPGIFPAPEQVSGERAGAATDVYALGLIYVALRFGLGSAREAARGAPLPEELGDLQPVIAQSLERHPLARHRSARELAGALGLQTEEWLHEEYRDCPLCRLKEEIQRDTGARAWSVPYASETSPRETPWVRYAWIVIILLAVATTLVWWLALR